MKKWKKILITIISLILITIGLAFAIYYLVSNQNNNNNNQNNNNNNQNNNNNNQNNNNNNQNNNNNNQNNNQTNNKPKKPPVPPRPIKNSYYTAPGDGSCALWSIATSYLWPARNNNDFKEKFQNLFGDQPEKDITKVQNLLKTSDISDLHSPYFESPLVKNLVRKVFRTKLVAYLEKEIKEEIKENDPNNMVFKALILNIAKQPEKNASFYEGEKYFYNEKNVLKDLNKKQELEFINNYLQWKKIADPTKPYGDTWCDTPEIHAAAAMLECNIELENKQLVTPHNSYDTYDQITLKYHEQIHYDFYLPNENKKAQ